MRAKRPLSMLLRLLAAGLLVLLLPTVPCVAADTPPSATAPSTPERLSADGPRTTTAGNTFVGPSGWTLVQRGNATILEAPEGGSFVAIVDVTAPDADAAVASAWTAYKPDAKWPLKAVTPIADRDGWTNRRGYLYQTSPNERRDVSADVRRANDIWTVTILDVAQDVGGKRGAQIALIYGRSPTQRPAARNLCREEGSSAYHRTSRRTQSLR